MSKTILHVPHSSLFIPEKYRNQFLLSDNELKEELKIMTDHFTDDLFCTNTGLCCIVAKVSRLLVDVERFVDDSREIMAQKGMGIIYYKTSNGKELRRELSEQEKNELLVQYYYSHHNLLFQEVNRIIKKKGACLIIDCHSFPSKPLPYEINSNLDRPDICIGTDDFHTPKK